MDYKYGDGDILTRKKSDERTLVHTYINSFSSIRLIFGKNVVSRSFSRDSKTVNALWWSQLNEFLCKTESIQNQRL